MLLPPSYKQKILNKPGWQRFKLTKRQITWLGLLSLVLFIVLVSVWYIFVGKNGNFSGENIDLKIELPQEAVNGETFEFKVSWQNKEKVVLEEVNLSFRYPVGFALVTEDGNRLDSYSVGRLDKLASGEKVFRAQILGEANEIKTLEAVLTYRPANFSSLFQKVSQGEVKLTEANLSFEFILPESLLDGEELNLKIKYKNTTNKDLEKLRIQLEYPAGFEFKKSDPVTTAKLHDMFSLLTLAAGEDGIISISGKLSGQAGDKKLFKASLGVVDQFKQFYPQISRSQEVLVVKPDVSLVFTAGKEQILNVLPGELVSFNIKYKNVGNVIIKNAVVEVNLKPQYFDLASLNIEQAGKFDGAKIIWDESADPELKELKSDKGGDLRFQLKVLDRDSLSQAGVDTFESLLTVRIFSRNVKELILIKYNQAGNEVKIKLISGLELAAEARYYNVDLAEVGSGPLPPVVGQETTYLIYFTLVNDFSRLENVRLVANLNPDSKVSYRAEDQTSAGSDLRYLADSKQIIWEIGNLEKSSDIQLVSASFRLALIPMESDKGKTVNLLEKISVTAYDPETGQEIKKESGPTDTELETDFGAVGKGKVQ